MAAMLTLLTAYLLPRTSFPLSVALACFSPFPIVVMMLQGAPSSLAPVVVAAVSGVLAILGGWTEALSYAGLFGLVALLAAFGIARKMEVPKLVALSALGTALALGLSWAALRGIVGMKWAVPLAGDLMRGLEAYLRPDLNLPEAAQSGSPWLAAHRDWVMGTAARVWPSLLVMNLAATVWLNLAACRLLFPKAAYFAAASPSGWKAPVALVWIFIACGLLTLSERNDVQTAAWNGILLGGAVFFAQGLAVVTFYFAKKQIPWALRFFGYLLILFQYVLALAVALVGLFDQWFDFRRLERAEEPGTE